MNHRLKKIVIHFCYNNFSVVLIRIYKWTTWSNKDDVSTLSTIHLLQVQTTGNNLQVERDHVCPKIVTSCLVEESIYWCQGMGLLLGLDIFCGQNFDQNKGILRRTFGVDFKQKENNNTFFPPHCLFFQWIVTSKTRKVAGDIAGRRCFLTTLTFWQQNKAFLNIIWAD